MRFRLVLLVLSIGCHRDPPAPPSLDVAEPAAVPSGAKKITCRIGPKQTMLPLDDAGLHLRFVTARGNTVSMLGRDVTVGDPEDVVLGDAIARLADQPAGFAWPAVDAKVTSPDGRTATEKVSLHIDGAMNERLEAARGAPFVFPGEAQGTSANKLAWVRPDDSAPYVIGEGRWRDIDLVAFESAKDVVGKVCGSQPNGFNDTTSLASHRSSHVELYDRRAGKRIDETVIDGPETCPGERTHAPSNAGAIRAWVASKLATP